VRRRSLNAPAPFDPAFFRQLRQVEEKVAKSTGGNYPSANAIVDCIKFGLTSSKQVCR